MELSSLPARPLSKSELLSLEEAVEWTAPLVAQVEYTESGVEGMVHGAVLVQQDHVTAIVFEDGSWRVLDRRERPVPPPVFEDQFREWAEGYPELVPLC